MKISGLQKLTLLDYPGYTACTIFTNGCNFRCPFCHNSSLVIRSNEQPLLPFKELYEFLGKRAGVLQGVCISGGEPCLQSDLIDFIQEIKQLGYLVKLDTNGCNPDMLVQLLEEHLLDYIAMDIKNSPEKYGETIGIPEFDISCIKNSADLIMNSTISYEFRTTIVKEFHTEEDIQSIGNWLNGADQYFLQKFKDSGDIIAPNLHSVDLETLTRFQEVATPYFGNVGIRG